MFLLFVGVAVPLRIDTAVNIYEYVFGLFNGVVNRTMCKTWTAERSSLIWHCGVFAIRSINTLNTHETEYYVGQCQQNNKTKFIENTQEVW